MRGKLLPNRCIQGSAAESKLETDKLKLHIPLATTLRDPGVTARDLSEIIFIVYVPTDHGG
jgi:hypothetical protein